MTYHTRPRVLAYRTWVEEEPEVSADQESYRRDIVGGASARSGLMLLLRSIVL